MNTKQLYLNIPKLYTIKALRWLMFVMPVIVLFFLDHGLSMTQVIYLQVIFSLIIVGLEVPSGYFADKVGRKISLVVASFLGFLGFLIYAFSFNFFGFLIAEIVLGIGSSFMSGADSALLYDTLIECGIQGKYKQIEGRYLAIGSLAEGIASIIGGFLALISLRTPIYFEVVAMFFAIPFSLTLVEPTRHHYQIARSRVREILKIVKYSLHEHKEIKWLIIYSGLINASTLTMVWFIQPLLQSVQLPLAWFGVVWAGLQLSVVVFSLTAHRYEAFFGRRRSLVPLIFIAVAGYVLLSLFQSWWSIIFIFFFYFIRGISGPILKDYVNRLISSDFRATILSVKALVGRVIFSIISPFIGWATDMYSLSVAFLLAAGLFAFFGIIPLLYLKKYHAV